MSAMHMAEYQGQSNGACLDESFGADIMIEDLGSRDRDRVRLATPKDDPVASDTDTLARAAKITLSSTTTSLHTTPLLDDFKSARIQEHAPLVNVGLRCGGTGVARSAVGGVHVAACPVIPGVIYLVTRSHAETTAGLPNDVVQCSDWAPARRLLDIDRRDSRSVQNNTGKTVIQGAPLHTTYKHTVRISTNQSHKTAAIQGAHPSRQVVQVCTSLHFTGRFWVAEGELGKLGKLRLFDSLRFWIRCQQPDRYLLL
ncbi:hypothetical protein BZA05DRAFT_438900 [Tricharina praecox]|uniref:uncharacterized protein n=1 Tax=Tricharina praecox TaxID=43433 RepID=UPI0022203C5A|nr:uncharacterized protein BZA05DRAFT_438900 [Tricharina praecox]KAI5844267.1 hypothetical protein BZA05DRAFT_438900 [Tricharina praecox]